MLHPLRTIKILLLCFALYMLMVLPVFADGVYKLPSVPQQNTTPAMAPIPSMHSPAVPPPSYYMAPNPSVAPSTPMPPVYRAPASSGAPMRTINPNAHADYRPYGAVRPSYVPQAPERLTYVPEDLWMQEGGARLQYDALPGPTQMYTNGMPVLDPANVHLPPLYPHRVKGEKRRGTRRTYAVPKPVTMEDPINRAWKVGTNPHVVRPRTQSVRPAPPKQVAPAPVTPAPAAPKPVTPKVENPAPKSASPYDGPASPVGGNTVQKIES